MASLLYRLGAFGARRWRTVLAGWLVVLAGVVALGVLVPGSFQSSDSIPGSPAQTALTEMDRHFPEPDVQSAQIVFQAPEGRQLSEPDLAAALEASLVELAAVTGVTDVGDPAGQLSADRRTSVVEVDFSTAAEEDLPPATLDAVRNAGFAAEQAGLRTVYGGDAFSVSTSPFGPTEVVGVLVALAVLVVTFGSLLSAGLPLLTAILGVVGTLTAMIAVSAVVDISDNAPTLAVMLGLAVGIDYALFILSRHRTQLATGLDVRESVARATATAGSAVVFAGATVVIALSGLAVAGVPMLSQMGLATAGAVAVAVLMALTLLPALLGLAGPRLVPRPGSRAAHRATHRDEPTLGTRWTALVMRYPVRFLVGVTVSLLAVAVPALSLELALSDDGSEATTTSNRQVYDIVSQEFGPGANGPLVVLVQDESPAAVESTADRVATELGDLAGVAQVVGVEVAADGAAARVVVLPTTGPRSAETSELVARLGTELAPIASETGSALAVTGQTAVSIDVSTKLGDALLPFALVVVGLSLLLLVVAFRSIAVPVKATVGFLLSVAAAFGATVAVFQWGWLGGLLGVPSEGPVASFVPIIVMAVLFGLAMDYEVFLVSAIREEHAAGRDARSAILAGSRNASRVVTAAALIMIAVFVSFLFSHDVDIMPIAFALAFGVLVDAFLVRMTLVPAVLTLLGDRAWALPGWLDRRLPHLDVEGGDLPLDPPAPPTEPGTEPVGPLAGPLTGPVAGPVVGRDAARTRVSG